LERLLRTAECFIEHRDEAWRALRLMDVQGADFADAFLGLINRKQGCEQTLTFDKAAGALAVFEEQQYQGLQTGNCAHCQSRVFRELWIRK
jgi:predicted nucleic-acid-binding protein